MYLFFKKKINLRLPYITFGDAKSLLNRVTNQSQTSDFVLSQELRRSQSHTVWFWFSRQSLTMYQAWLGFLMLLPQPGLYGCYTQPKNTHIPTQWEMCSLSDEIKKKILSLSPERDGIWYFLKPFWSSGVAM